MPHGEIYEAHPEVYHYTTHHGLRGIIKSGTLWATHYRNLNDENEVMQFKPHFIERLRPHVEDEIRRLFRKSFRIKRMVRKEGGIQKLAALEAANLVNAFYQVTYEGGRTGKPQYADPYIASFCSHSCEDSYVQENGLLSQWRAYGAGGGCAIVFDTQKLTSLISGEVSKYHVALAQFGDVVYDNQSDQMEREFQSFFEFLPNLFPAFISLNVDEFDNVLTSEKAFVRFTSATTRVKHRGFREEREVRIVISPEIQKHHALLKSKYPDVEIPHKEFKEIKVRGNSIPYIELFDGRETTDLPIKRIIVGPHSEKEQIASEIRKEVRGKGIEVACSETPYVERAVAK